MVDSVNLADDPTDEENSTALDSVCLDATLRGPATRRVIGNNIGHHLFQYIRDQQDLMSKVQTELHDNIAKIDRLDKTVQGLQAENRRLRSVKHSSQVVRSRLFENYQKAASLGSHDRTAITSGDRVAHRGCIDEDWQLYEDGVRSDFDVFLKVYGISHGEARMYIGDQFFTPTISTNTS